MEGQADQLVMLAVRDGDVERIGVLFDRHHRMLFNFFLRLTANRGLSEDLVQEVFFRMLKYRHTFQAGTNFTAWMYQIARNAQIDQAQEERPVAREEAARGPGVAGAELLQQLTGLPGIGGAGAACSSDDV